MSSRVLLLALAAVGLVACDRSTAPSQASAPVAKAAPTATGAPSSKADPAPSAPPETVYVPQVTVARSGATKVHVGWQLPAGTGVNDGAPFHVRWTTSEGLQHAPEDMRAKGSDVTQGFDVLITPTVGAPSATLAGEVKIVVCDVATHRVCVPVTRRIEMEFLVVGKDGTATVSVPLPAAKPQTT